MRSSSVLVSAMPEKSSGCSPQYEEYSSNDVPERIKEGAVNVDRSPENVAMDLRKLVHVLLLASVMVEGATWTLATGSVTEL